VGSDDGWPLHRNLATNKLNGTIPGSLADLSQLTYLYVWAAKGMWGVMTDHLCMCVAPLTHPLGRNLCNNRLTGVVPNLPFAQYTNGCTLQYDPPSNRFACPLPQVRQRRRALHVAAARCYTHTTPSAAQLCHPSICMLSLIQQVHPPCHSPPHARTLNVTGLR
jgi:hypothetical protein